MWKIEEESQLRTLRALYILTQLCYAIIIAYSIFNVTKFYKKLPQQSWIIWGFYILVFVQSLGYFTVFLLLSIQPYQSPYYLHEGEEYLNNAVHDWIVVLEVFSQSIYELFFLLLIFISF